jgi:hypothetical protein
LQTKPEAVVMRKLQRNAVHQPSRSDHTDYVFTIPRQRLRRGLPDRTTARQYDRETSAESLHHVVVSNCQLGPTSAARDVCGMQRARATWPCIPL